VIDLPEGRDVNDLLQELGPEKLKSFMLQASMEAKTISTFYWTGLKRIPDDETAREEALLFTAKIKSGVNRICEPISCKKFKASRSHENGGSGRSGPATEGAGGAGEGRS